MIDSGLRFSSPELRQEAEMLYPTVLKLPISLSLLYMKDGVDPVSEMKCPAIQTTAGLGIAGYCTSRLSNMRYMSAPGSKLILER